MYQIGEHVLYGIHGVCQIIDLEIKTVDRKRVEYYVLRPVSHEDARFYVPTQNAAAVAKLRPVMNLNELNDLLDSEQVRQDAWIEDENQRKQRYRDLINSGDRAALVSMVRTLHRHKKEQTAAGKKFHLCDENFLRDAEKLLNSEFSLILNIQQNQVGEFLRQKMNEE